LGWADETMSDARGTIQFYNVPELRDPYLVAAWSGMGAVALLTVNYLREELRAQLFGRIDPPHYYAPSQVLIEDGLIQPITLPETRFYYWHSGSHHDLVLVVGTEQPSDAYRMAVEISTAAAELGVQRVYTAAAYPTFIHHTSDPAVWGTATHADLLIELENLGVNLMRQGTIGGLNGLLLSVAKEHEIDGACLLGEIPIYTTQMVNPKASQAVLWPLMHLLGVEVSLQKLAVWAQDLQPQMDQLYEMLPEHAREALQRGERPAEDLTQPSSEAEPPLVADEAFFDEIERFLSEQRGSPDDAASDEDEPEA
jgi:proteasome assembly chaperone (PAC2) family protein